jgi:hypothetical protein
MATAVFEERLALDQPYNRKPKFRSELQPLQPLNEMDSIHSSYYLFIPAAV